jgi:hypothetical protein
VPTPNSRWSCAGGWPGPIVLAAVLAVVAATIGGSAAPMGQLSERPLIDAAKHPAIDYFTQPTHDPVADLARRIDAGTTALPFDKQSGYLAAVLDALHVPISSQMLVMSKTGVQGLDTGPENPRAIYFTDNVTIGYIRGASLLEFAVHDPTQGVVFYTIDQKPQTSPGIERRSGCLTCHQVYRTLHVPGLLARSVFIAPDGLPLGGQFASYDPDDRSPFRQRWGGWYVTGTHGSMRHMGNAIVTNAADRESIVSDRTLNRTSLEGRFDPSGYPSTHSDIAALMVFQHQVHMTNLITRVGWESRIAAHNGRADVSATSPLRDAVDELVDYLLFVDEEPLTAPVRGTSGFAEMFSAQGPQDPHGRSLRQLDLDHRLLRYPCSYMIYTPAFAGLPGAVRQAIYARMWEILSGHDTAVKYARLSESDRAAVIDILRDTLPDLSDAFRPAHRHR